MKNVLFIVYYFPPMGGSGVQRSLKFAKYLREFGWTPVILCPEPGAYQFFDQSLENELKNLNLEIHQVEAKTPFHSLGGSKKGTGLITGITAKVLRKISKWIYFPDNKKGWIKPAITEGSSIIESKKIDLIFSSAPPFSNHLIAERLSEQFKIPFVSDYRDLFSSNQFDVNESDKRKRKKYKLEAEWLSKSSGVTVLDDFAKNLITNIDPSVSGKIKVIPHGFDQDDFKEKDISNFEYKEGKLNWLYSGLFYESNQPDIFLNAIKKVGEKNESFINDIHLHFQGGLDSRIKKLIKRLELEKSVTDYGYLSHNISAVNLMEADILWMISSFSESLKQIKSGKLFEYIGAKKPVLGLVHEGEASKILEKYKIGYHARPNNINDVTAKVEEIYQLWKLNKYPEVSDEFVEHYNRKKLSGELATFFDEITKKHEYMNA